MACAAMTATAASLSGVKTVYLLPMPGNLDQFLAMRLTIGAILQVVTDPANADAIFTPQTGAAFEQRMTELSVRQSQRTRMERIRLPHPWCRVSGAQRAWSF